MSEEIQPQEDGETAILLNNRSRSGILCKSRYHGSRLMRPRGEAMRIWYSDAPYAVCGLYQVCSMLKDCDCPVLVVKLPEYQLKNEKDDCGSSKLGRGGPYGYIGLYKG